MSKEEQDNYNNFKKAIGYLRLKGYSEYEAINIYLRSFKMKKRGWEYMINCQIVDEIKDILGIDDGKRRLGFILYWLFKSYKTNTWLRVSKKKSYYDNIPNGMGYIFLIENIINPLIEMNYLEEIKGDESAKFQTRVRPSPILIKMFEAYDQIKIDKEIISLKKSMPIVVKNSSKKTVSFSSSNREARKMIKNIASINASVIRSKITIKEEVIKDIDNRITQEILGLRHSLLCNTGPLGVTNIEKLQYLCGLQADLNMSLAHDEINDITNLFYYYRVFNQRSKGNNSSYFKFGGRFYCAGSSLPLKSIPVRDGILIEGEETIELDYSALHPTMIAVMENASVSSSHDPYGLPSCLAEGWHRDDHKMALNALLNCKSKRSANSYLKSKGLSNPKEYIEAVINHNPWMEKYIATDAGVKLQRMDSELAENVMVRFIEKTGSAILCWHDSFRVKESEGQILKEIMQDEFFKMFKSSITIK